MMLGYCYGCILVWQSHPARLSFLYRLVAVRCQVGVAASERAAGGKFLDKNIYIYYHFESH
jgi:hypothetical protein